MRVPTRLISALVGVVGVLALSVAPAQGTEDPGICSRRDGAHISGSFFLNACFDGSNLVLENRSDLVLRANTSPYVAPPTLTPLGPSNTLASQVVIDIEGFSDHPDPYLIPPGTRLTIPTGEAGNRIELQYWEHRQFQYVIADVLLPLLPPWAIADGAVGFFNDVTASMTQFWECRAASNFLGDVACQLEASAAISVALVDNLGTAVLELVSPAKLIDVLLDVYGELTVLGASLSQQGQIESFQDSDKVVTVDPAAAAPAPAPTPTPTNAPPATSAPAPTPNAPSPSPAPSPAATGIPETTGGVTHTWTNYTNAGGVEGPTIPAFTTVLIACRLPGFAVQNGNTWWYRIAQSPWSSQYYASADAFYNNGQTSGDLRGTPYVDMAVPSC